MDLKKVKEFVTSNHFSCFMYGAGVAGCLVGIKIQKGWKKYLSVLGAVGYTYSAYDCYRKDKNSLSS